MSDEEPVCYLCCLPIAPEEEDREHVIPKSLFPKGHRDNLITLPSHVECNRELSRDDEYFRLCMTAASPQNPQAQKVWKGPVVRGVHRSQSAGFKSSILEKLGKAEVLSESGLYLGTADAMLQDAARIIRVTDRIVRGLHCHLAGSVLPKDWPVESHMMPPYAFDADYGEWFDRRLYSVGGGVFLFGWKHDPEDCRESMFWLVFYGSVHFMGFTGRKIRALFPW